MALSSGCIAGSLKHRRHYFATRKTPLNTSRVLQCSGKGATWRCTKVQYTFGQHTLWKCLYCTLNQKVFFDFVAGFCRSRSSANSFWQGGRRRTHSVKGGLPKWDFFCFTLAGRYRYTHSVAHWLPKWIWRAFSLNDQNQFQDLQKHRVFPLNPFQHVGSKALLKKNYTKASIERCLFSI